VVTISRALRLVPVAVLVLGLAACADDGSEAGDGAPRATASNATGATTDATPTAPDTPAVVPANGKEVSVEAVSMRLTDAPKWNVSQFGTTFVAGLPLGTQGKVSVTVQDILASPSQTTEDKAVSFEEVLAKDDPAPKRVANRVVDGVDCFVLDGRNDKVHHYVVGGVVNSRFFLLQFRVPVVLPDGDQMIEQMLASVDIKGA
jgi:hypothetical protein